MSGVTRQLGHVGDGVSGTTASDGNGVGSIVWPLPAAAVLPVVGTLVVGAKVGESLG